MSDRRFKFAFEDEYAEVLGESQTSDTSWSDKVVLVTSSFPAGDYLVGWSAELYSSKTNNECEAQVVVDGVGDPIFEGAHDRKSWLSCSGFGEVALTGNGVRTVRFQYRKSPDAVSQAAAYIRRASLKIRPL